MASLALRNFCNPPTTPAKTIKATMTTLSKMAREGSPTGAKPPKSNRDGTAKQFAMGLMEALKADDFFQSSFQDKDLVIQAIKIHKEMDERRWRLHVEDQIRKWKLRRMEIDQQDGDAGRIADHVRPILLSRNRDADCERCINGGSKAGCSACLGDRAEILAGMDYVPTTRSPAFIEALTAMHNLPDKSLHTHIGMGFPMEFTEDTNVWVPRELAATDWSMEEENRMEKALKGRFLFPPKQQRVMLSEKWKYTELKKVILGDMADGLYVEKDVDEFDPEDDLVPIFPIDQSYADSNNVREASQPKR
jgi:hypothetical protein